jgi:hypothetical protein
VLLFFYSPAKYLQNANQLSVILTNVSLLTNNCHFVK